MSGVTGVSENALQFEKDSRVWYCFIIYWDEDKVKKVCVDVQSLDEELPNAELKPVARLFFGLEFGRLPMVVRGASPSLMQVLGDTREDSRRFVVYQRFTGMLSACSPRYFWHGGNCHVGRIHHSKDEKLRVRRLD